MWLIFSFSFTLPSVSPYYMFPIPFSTVFHKDSGARYKQWAWCHDQNKWCVHLISKPRPFKLLLGPKLLMIFRVQKCNVANTENISHMQRGCFCKSAHLFTLAALYLHTETLKPGLGSHISRPRDIHPDFRPNRDGWLSEGLWDGFGSCRTRRPIDEISRGFMG